jgi:hypothetical protein
MRQILIVAVAALVALPTAARAQAKPNFSGSWTWNQGRSPGAPGPARGARGGGGGGGGRGGAGAVPESLTITQTATQITIERAMAGGALTSAIYNLDGSESGNVLGDVFLSKSKVSWDGAKLVIATTKDFGEVASGGMAQENTKEAYSLDGDVLTVTTTLPGTPAMPVGGQTRTLVYNKKS